MKVVCDASLLIELAKIGKLDLLRKLYCKIYVPYGVHNEAIAAGAESTHIEQIDRAKWIRKVKVKNTLEALTPASELGQGASEVLVLL